MKGWVNKVNSEAYFNAATAMECETDTLLKVPDTKILRGMTNTEIENILRDPNYELMGNTGMVVERIQGPDVTFHAFCQNGLLSCRTVSINDQMLLPGGQGPDIGDNATTIFCGRSNYVDPIIERLAEMAISHEKEYTGFINLAVTFRNRIPYYKSISYGYTYKFLASLLQLYNADMDSFFIDGSYRDVRENGVPGFGVSLRVWSYPWIAEENGAVSKYTIERNQGLMLSESKSVMWDGESYCALGRGARIKETWRDLYSMFAGMPHGVCYRTDAELKARRVFNEIMRGQYVQKSNTSSRESDHNSGPVPGGDGSGILPDAACNQDKEENGDQNADSLP